MITTRKQNISLEIIAHSVTKITTLYLHRLTLLKDRPSQSKSPTPSFYQHFKNSRPNSFNRNFYRNRSRS